jgi:hypothetical protein
MKFKIVPTSQYDICKFTKGKQEIWVSVDWGFCESDELNEYSSDLFEDCSTIEQVQKAVDDAVSKQDSRFEDDLYDSAQIGEALKLDNEVLLNTTSGGGASCGIIFHKNVSAEEFKKKLDDDGEIITLEDAANNWRDEVLTNDGWEEVVETYYYAPLKVVNILTDEQQAELEASAAFQIDKIENRAAKNWIYTIDELFTTNKPAKAKIDLLKKRISYVKDKDLELVLRFYEEKHGDTEFKGSGIKKIDNNIKINFIKGLKQ